MIIKKVTADSDGFIVVDNAIRFLNFRIIDHNVAASIIVDPFNKTGRRLVVHCKRDGDVVNPKLVETYFATLSDEKDDTFHLFEYKSKLKSL